MQIRNGTRREGRTRRGGWMPRSGQNAVAWVSGFKLTTRFADSAKCAAPCVLLALILCRPASAFRHCSGPCSPSITEVRPSPSPTPPPALSACCAISHGTAAANSRSHGCGSATGDGRRCGAPPRSRLIHWCALHWDNRPLRIRMHVAIGRGCACLDMSRVCGHRAWSQ